jgi:UDP-3-O-[3-hydroxymyristoyl] glucosamine N-acyltransferase
VTENEGLSGSDGLRLGDGVVVGDDVVVDDGVVLDDAAAAGDAVVIGCPRSSSSQADAARNMITSAAFLSSFLSIE